MKEIRTFYDVITAIIDRARLDDNEDVRESIKEKVNTKYQQIGFKEAYSWSGDTRPLKLKASYSTGTVTVTSDSETVTGSGTTWTQALHEGARIQLGSAPFPYKILRVASTTSITLDSPYIGTTTAGVTYKIFKNEYGLFPDLSSIRRMTIPGLTRRPLPASPLNMEEYNQAAPFAGGLPRFYSINGLNIYSAVTWADFKINTDFFEDDYDDKPRNKNLIIWPAIFTADRIASIRYTRVVPPMVSDSEEPLIPYENRVVLVYGVLLEHFLQGRDELTKKSWENLYKEQVKDMAGQIESVDDELILTVDRRRVGTVFEDLSDNE